MQPNTPCSAAPPQSKLSDFQVHEKLGEGAFSTVYRVTRRSDSQVYALKKVKMSLLSERERVNALNEVRILASLRDQYIIGYKESIFDEVSQCLCIVQEYAEGGDLMGLITRHAKQRNHIEEELVWGWAVQMILGLKTLHDTKILHRDLKAANVFLCRDRKTVKLGDLNVSKVTKRNQMAHTQTGTPYYAAPEIWKDSPYNCKADIWSLGCVLYELCALRPPFRAQDMEGLFRRIQRGHIEQIPPRYSQDLQDFITMCLQQNPSLRPTADQLLRIPSLQKHLQQELVANQARRANTQEAPLPQSSSSSSQSQVSLISTIKMPKKLSMLRDLLPRAQYEQQLANGAQARYIVLEGRRSPTARSKSIDPLQQYGGNAAGRPVSRHAALVRQSSGNNSNNHIVRERSAGSPRHSSDSGAQKPPIHGMPLNLLNNKENIPVLQLPPRARPGANSSQTPQIVLNKGSVQQGDNAPIAHAVAVAQLKGVAAGRRLMSSEGARRSPPLPKESIFQDEQGRRLRQMPR